MGRSANPVVPLAASASSQNPISGVFGSGKVRFITVTGTFTVPVGVSKVRVRLWGAGSMSGTAGGTSSFGNYVSATGGAADGSAGGTGVGGDVNNQGGAFVNSGGGAASLIGPGGTTTTQARGGAGAGGFYAKNGGSGFEGFTGRGGRAEYWPANNGLWHPYAGEIGRADILDFIGTGGGGATSQTSNDSTTYSADGANGGGGGAATITAATYAGRGGFPGGGHGNGGAGGGFAMKEIDVTPGQQITVTVGATPAGNGGSGLVIVEW